MRGRKRKLEDINACQHHEIIRDNIGTCIYCGRVKDYNHILEKAGILVRLGKRRGRPAKLTRPAIRHHGFSTREEYGPAWENGVKIL